MKLQITNYRLPINSTISKGLTYFLYLLKKWLCHAEFISASKIKILKRVQNDILKRYCFLMLFFLLFFAHGGLTEEINTKKVITYHNYIQILEKQDKTSKINWSEVKDALLMLYLWEVEAYPYTRFADTGKHWLKISKNVLKNKSIDVKLATILSYLLINNSVEASNIQVELLKEKGINKNPYYLIIDSFLNTNYALGDEARIFYYWNKNKAEEAIQYSPQNSLIYVIANYVKAEALRAENGRTAEPVDLMQKALLGNNMDILEQILTIKPDNLLFILKKGHYLLLNNQDNSADKIFKEISTDYPSLDFIMYIIGNYYFINQKYANSLPYYKQAISVSKKCNLEAHRSLEAIYLYTGDYNSAIKMYEDAINLYPDIVDLYYRLSFVYKEAKLPADKIIKLLTKGITRFPDNFEFNLRLAYIYHDAKKFESAIVYYKKALTINPKFLEIYDDLASIYVEQQKYTDAINILKQGIKKNSQFISGYYKLATIYLKQENIDKALSYAEKIIELDSNYTSGYNLLGFLYRQKKQYGKAITHLKKALELEPGYLDALLNLGDVYYEQKNYRQALSYYKDADNIEPYNENVYFSIGNTFSESGDYKNAMNFLARAILINPKNLEARNNLGNLYIKQKLFNPAINEFNRILQINSKYATAYYNLACVYSLTNEKNLAFNYLNTAINLDEKLKKIAEKDNDLDNIRRDKRFREIIK